MRGQVVNIHSNTYVVYADGKKLECLARGVLRVKSDGIIVGDYVDFDVDTLTVSRVLPRTNKFIRPNVSNIDAVNIVIASPPQPDFMMLDKLLLSLLANGVDVIITVNKSDLKSDVFDDVIRNYNELGFPIVSVSAVSGAGICDLKKLFKGKLVAFAGQSAVGKSSLLNAMFNLDIRTGDVSAKTNRGKHTTTSASIYHFDDIKVVDTPGFSVIKPDILPEEVALFYPEYFALLSQCKFRGCTHTGEPGCKVQEAVNNGKLCLDRYLRYKTIYSEIKNEYDNRF